MEEAWRHLSTEIGAAFAQGKSPDDITVLAKVKHWTIKLQTEVRETGGYYSTKQRFSWMQAHYVSKDGFRFEIYRRRPFSNLWLKLLRMSGVEVGCPEIDRHFIVKGNDESKVRRLFASGGIRHLIRHQPSIHLQVREDKPDASLAHRVHLLYCPVGGRVIIDVERLRSLFRLFEETLGQLCHMGSAFAGGPAAWDLRSLDELRKLDPQAAERIADAVESGRASIADVGALVAKARQRLVAEGRLPRRGAPPREGG